MEENIYQKKQRDYYQKYSNKKKCMVYGKEPTTEDNKGKMTKRINNQQPEIVDNDYIKEIVKKKQEERNT